MPIVDARFPEWSEVFEEVIGVFDGFALLYNTRIVVCSSQFAL